MGTAPSLGIPELAGIASYKEATRIGLSVDDAARRLRRYHWVEKRLARVIVARLPATPEWEVKGGFALHQWLDFEHAANLAARIAELDPDADLASPPDDPLEAFLLEVEQAQDTMELLAGVYRIARADLVLAYRLHIDAVNPLVDYPTRRALRLNLQEEEEALGWGARSLGALIGSSIENEARIRKWEEHLRQYLGAARGIAGDLPPNRGLDLPTPRALRRRAPDLTPRRDDRFPAWPGAESEAQRIAADRAATAMDRNIALLVLRLLAMNVAEVMASIIAERPDLSETDLRDLSRQIWDEARHAMAGEAAFEARRVDWTRVPATLSPALELITNATPEERQLLLYAIEQQIIQRRTTNGEIETANAAGDPLAVHFFDFQQAADLHHAQCMRDRLAGAGQLNADLAAQVRHIQERIRVATHEQKEASGTWWSDFLRLATPTQES